MEKIKLEIINPYEFEDFLESGKVKSQKISPKNMDKILNNKSINVISGPANSGKTTLCLKLIKKAQEQKKTILLIDNGYSVNQEYIRSFDIKLEHMCIYCPDYSINTSENIVDFLKDIAFLSKNSLVIFDCLPESIKVSDNLINYIKTVGYTLVINHS